MLDILLPTLGGLLYVTLWIWVFWALFVMVMGFYRAKLDGRLTGILLYLAFPWYVLGWAIDFVSQMTLATVIFLDLPREALVTTRLQRYVAGPTGWRRSTAVWICESLLDVFDPSGDHC